MKKCMKCNVKQPLVNFYKHKKMADGHLNKCKECTKNEVKENRKKNIDYYRQYAREKYATNQATRDATAASAKKWAAKNPIKRAAQIIVGNAVRDGRLHKEAMCQECGDEHKRIHGHHDDYSQPLVVRWLCPSCHTKWHLENGEGKYAN